MTGRKRGSSRMPTSRRWCRQRSIWRCTARWAGACGLPWRSTDTLGRGVFGTWFFGLGEQEDSGDFILHSAVHYCQGENRHRGICDVTADHTLPRNESREWFFAVESIAVREKKHKHKHKRRLRGLSCTIHTVPTVPHYPQPPTIHSTLHYSQPPSPHHSPPLTPALTSAAASQTPPNPPSSQPPAQTASARPSPRQTPPSPETPPAPPAACSA